MLNKEILGYYCDNKKTYPSIHALVKYNKYSIITIYKFNNEIEDTCLNWISTEEILSSCELSKNDFFDLLHKHYEESNIPDIIDVYSERYNKEMLKNLINNNDSLLLTLYSEDKESCTDTAIRETIYHYINN